VALTKQFKCSPPEYRRREAPAARMFMYVAWRSLIAALLLLAVSASIALHAETENEGYSILVVASDLGDVMWAHRMGEALNQLGVNATVEILYIGRDYPEAQSARSKLTDLGFLWRFRAILVPDLNREFTWGGRLSDVEIEALRLYVERGHLLMIGLNTYIHSWHPVLDQLAGASVAGLAGGANDTEALDIVVGGTIYRYNDTFGAVLVYQRGCRAEAYFYAFQQYPAICVNSFGDGVVVLAAFNVVEAVVSQDNGFDMALLLAKVLKEKLNSVHPKPLSLSYTLGEIIRGAAVKPIESLAGIFGGGLIGYTAAAAIIAAALYAALQALSLLCLLPRRLRAPIVRPLTRLAKLGGLEQRVLDALWEAVLADVDELAQSVGVDRVKVCRALTLLEARRLVKSTPFDGRIVYFLREDEQLIVLGLNPLYRDILDLVAAEPGITVTEIAARLSIPPDAALKACRELALRGIIELRKVSLDCEAYPGAFVELKKPRARGGAA